MARTITSPRSARRLARRPALAILAFCLLSLAFIPSATAKRDRTTTTSATPVTETPSSTEADGEVTPVEHPRRQARAEQRLADAEAQPPASAPAGRRATETSSPEHPRRAAARAGSEATGTPVSGSGSVTAAAKTQKNKGGKGGKEKSEKGEKAKGKSNEETSETPKKKKTKGKRTNEPEGGETTPPVEEVAAPAETSAPVASAASVAPATPAVDATVLPVTAQLTTLDSTIQPSGAANRASAARRRTRRASSSAPGAGATLAATSSAAGAGSPTAAGGTSGTAPVSRSRVRVIRSSPLVHTITRIADVVPTPIRVLIVALLALALALAVRSRVAVLRARRLGRQRAQLLEDVGLLQAALLPVPPARLGPVGTSVAYQPAAGPGAGGDFYDVFALADGQLGVIVGDVSGHGRHSLPHTALLRFTLRAYLDAGLPPRDAVRMAGSVLDRQLGDSFATVVVAKYEPRSRKLVYSCAGHPPPVVLGGAPDAIPVPQVTACSSPPIGVGMRTGTRQTTISIPGRAKVCFFTDGVTEARIGTELFGSERLAETLAEIGEDASAPQLLDAVLTSCDEHPDDMAACLLSIEGDELAPRALSEEVELDFEQTHSSRSRRFLLACGVDPEDVPGVLAEAADGAGRTGTTVLELQRTDGAPEITVRGAQLARLDERRATMAVAR